MPDCDAAGHRVLGIAKSLRLSGWQVEFLAWGAAGSSGNSIASIENFPLHVIGEFRSEAIGILARLRHYWQRGQETINYLENIDTENIDTLICYNANSKFIKGVQKFCERNAINFIIDCTEWYQPSHLPGGKFGPVAIDEILRMRSVNLSADGIIVISRFLEQFYRARGAETILVPPTIDCEAPRWRAAVGSAVETPPVRFCYAGNPGKKDSIGQIIAALALANRIAIPVYFQIIGPSREQIIALNGDTRAYLEELGDRVEFTGRVKPDQIPRLLQTNHFSIIARPSRRYAMAGFPTKLVESLAAGLPVVTTASGDEGVYVRDGLEGFVAAGDEPEQLLQAIAKCAQLSRSDWVEMADNARKRAIEMFDYRVYASDLSNFIRQSGAS